MRYLPFERYRKAHHSYVTEIVDAAVFRKEAQARAFDNRQQEDTVIHFHEYDENNGNCKGKEHEHYAAGVGKL
jgi:hypothetical protein